MYTIIMNNDKQLIGSKKTTLYQREKLADQIRFLIPQQILMQCLHKNN